MYIGINKFTMNRLDPNWFVKGPDDVEYRQYILLAWLQEVQKEFSQTYLYPALSELVFHYENLVGFRDAREKFSEGLKKDLKEIDLKNMKLKFDSAGPETEEVERINEVVDFAIPRVKKELTEGKEMYEFIEKQIEIEPVGLLPMYKTEGYLLLAPNGRNEVKAYRYNVGLIVDPAGNYRQITTEFVHSFTYSLAPRFEEVKLKLVRTHPQLPNPATFGVITELEFPERETLLPVVKRKFLRYLLKDSEK